MTTLTTPHSLAAGSGDHVGGESEPVSAPTTFGPVSPELVLVDPELAQLLRETSDADVNGFRCAEAEPQPWGGELRSDATGRQMVIAAPRRLRKRLLRPVGIAVAAIALGGAGAALGGLFSASSPEAAMTEAGAPTAQHPTPTILSTGRTKNPLEPAGEPRIVAWAPAPGAAAYDVALYDGSRRIFLERTRNTRLALPIEWSYGGRRRRLERGVYRWYVWPVPTGARRPSATPVVQASLTIPAS